LNYRHFVTGRSCVYNETTGDIKILEAILTLKESEHIRDEFYRRIALKILPSACFSLAAKSALIAYQSNHPDEDVRNTIHRIINNILSSVEQEVNRVAIDWNKP